MGMSTDNTELNGNQNVTESKWVQCLTGSGSLKTLLETQVCDSQSNNDGVRLYVLEASGYPKKYLQCRQNRAA